MSRTLVVAALIAGCRTKEQAPVADAAPTASAAAPVVVVDAGPPWPSLDATSHCASLRAIAGEFGRIEAWRPDVSLLLSPIVPSGFTDCTDTRTQGRRQASLNWAVHYQCYSAAASSEEVAVERFGALTAIWAECLAPTHWRKGRPEEADAFTLEKSGPDHRIGCRLERHGAGLQFLCYESHNN